MTFDDDHMRLKFEGGPRTYFLKQFNLEWPPPKKIEFMGFLMKRVKMSEITDDQRSKMISVCRGAEYEIVET